MRRNFIFWGIILVVFGGIFVWDGFDLLPGNPLEYLWLLFLIILGSWIVISSFWKPYRGESKTISVGTQGAQRAKIQIAHGAGHLTINSGAEKGNLLTYSSQRTIHKEIKLLYDFLDVRLSPDSEIIPLAGLSESLNWDIKLCEEIPLSLIMETGASQTTADLSKLNITDLKLSTGASTTSITLPSIPEHAKVSINAGIAAINIQIPTNVAARIRVKDGLSSLSINKDRFVRLDDNTYQSHDFTQHANRTDIRIEAGLGSITIK